MPTAVHTLLARCLISVLSKFYSFFSRCLLLPGFKKTQTELKQIKGLWTNVLHVDHQEISPDQSHFVSLLTVRTGEEPWGLSCNNQTIKIMFWTSTEVRGKKTCHFLDWKKKWMEWSLIYTETKSTAECRRAANATIHAQIRFDAVSEKEEEKKTHGNEDNFTSAMYTRHICETDSPFSADNMKIKKTQNKHVDGKEHGEKRIRQQNSLMRTLLQVSQSAGYSVRVTVTT